MMLAKTILLVEDEAPLREAIKFKLEKGGFRVIEARTGEEALMFLKDHIPDLVWLDLLLPGINGVEVLKQIREDPKTKDLKVVVVSVSIASDKIKDISQYYVTECIIKSNFPLAELIKNVTRHLDVGEKK
jgi:CheY-like chemotaxis protein